MQCAVAKREKWILALTSAGIVGADQLVKGIVSGFPEGKVIINLQPLFQIVRAQNSGAAFSVMNGQVMLLLILTTCMLVGGLGVIFFYKGISRQARRALAVLAGGGIGNWLDRFLSGTVTDYICLKFIEFPIFNIADICISVSVIYLIALLFFDRFENHTGEKHGTGY